MKHIFKKLHIGSNHDPNRSNDAPSSTVSPTCAADHRASAAVQSPLSPPPSTPSPSSTATVPETAATPPPPPVPAVNRQDYYSSEEEYQVQLALALSVSGPDSNSSNRDKDQIRAVTWQGSNSVRERDAAADLLSRQYWLTGDT